MTGSIRRLVLPVAVLVSARPALADALDLRAALVEARAHGPRKVAASGRREAGHARAVFLPPILSGDPNVEVMYGTGRPPQEKRLDANLSLPLDVSAVGAAKRAAAGTRHRETEARFEAEALEADFQVASAFVKLAFAARRTTLAREAEEQAQRLADAMARRLGAGDASRLDVDQATMALAAARAQTASRAGETEASAARLAALLGRPPGSPVAVADADSPVAAPAIASQADAVRRAQDAPGVRAEREAARAAALSARAEARAAIHPLEMVVGYTHERSPSSGGPDDVVDLLVLGARFDLPIFDLNRLGRGESRAAHLEAQVASREAELEADVEVRVAWAAARAAQLAAAAARDGAAAATEAIDLLEKGWRAGEIDRAALFADGERALEARRRAVDALEHLAETRLELRRRLGLPPID